MYDDGIILGDITFTAAEVTRTYRSLVIQSPYTIILHDKDGIRFVNPAGLRMFGVPDLSHLRGRSLFTEFISEDRREAVATLFSTSSPQTLPPIDAKLHNAFDQVIDVEIWATSVTVDGQELVQATLRDISSRKLIEEIRQRQHEWKIIRNFIGHLADKTLNPLTTIEGFLMLLKEGANDVNIDMLLDEAKSIQRIWSQTIDISQNTNTSTRANEDLFNETHETI